MTRDATGVVVSECRVVVCGAADIFHRGLVAVLSEADGVVVVGQADGRSYSPQELAGLRPGVIVVDLDALPEMRHQVIENMSTLTEGTVKIVALASFWEPELSLQIVKSGAVGLLVKSAPTTELVAAVQVVYGGGAVLDPRIAKQVLQQLRSGYPPRIEYASRAGVELTARQREILALVGKGLNNDEIAQLVYLSRPTVKSHISALLRVLGLRDRTQLAIFACRNVVDVRGTGQHVDPQPARVPRGGSGVREDGT